MDVHCFTAQAGKKKTLRFNEIVFLAKAFVSFFSLYLLGFSVKRHSYEANRVPSGQNIKYSDNPVNLWRSSVRKITAAGARNLGHTIFIRIYLRDRRCP